MFHVHKSDSRAGRKIESGHAGAVDVDREINERRAVGLFMRRHSQRWHAILREPLVTQPVELTLAGDAREWSLNLRQVQRLADI